jgi:hypothetical protein
MTIDYASKFNGSATKALLVALVLMITTLSWSGVTDRMSEKFVDASFNKAIAAFATARALNGAVSVAQSATVSIGIGAEAELSPGEILDPINDLVEDYSSVMKLAIISLVIQKTLLLVVSEPVFNVLLSLSGVALIGSIHWRMNVATAFVFKVFASLAFLRFILTGVVLLNGLVNHAFIDNHRNLRVERLNSVSGDISASVGNEAGVSMGALDLDLVEIERETELTKQEVAEAQEKLDTAQSQRSLVDRINLFSENAVIKAASEDLASAESKLADLLAKRCEVMRLAGAKEADSACGEVPVSMRAKGLVAAVGRAMTSAGKAVTTAVDVAGLLRKLEAAVEDMVASMALFILQTLLLPIFFLFLLSKAMKKVWRINLKSIHVAPKKTAIAQ